MTLRILEQEKQAWKKGDKTNSQSSVYTRLPQGHNVYFYQEGVEGTNSFVIEIAIDPILAEEFYKRYEEIRAEVIRNSRGRKFCLFNM